MIVGALGGVTTKLGDWVRKLGVTLQKTFLKNGQAVRKVDSPSKLDPRNSIIDPPFSKTSRIEARVEFRDARGLSRNFPENDGRLSSA